ncbi:MAG TPA: TonB-dependent receptor [Hyphomicrobiaceae bacterium]|nr:TonB-dependent receptor [Hyphomicrobiaceae bacterium]
MPVGRFVRGMVLGLGGLAVIAAPERMLAQEELPDLTVTAPKKKPPRQARKKGTRPASTTAATSPAPSKPTPPAVAAATFSSITTVPATDIAATPGSNLADSLMNQPGVTGSSFAPGANRPIIRGLDNNRVRVQENGIAAQDVSALSEDHAVPIDPFAADNIEIIRGPATLRYGSQAIGGVVSANSERIPTIIPLHGFTAQTMGGVTSVNNGVDGAFKTTAGSGNFAVHADAFARHANDYGTPRGTQANSFVDNSGFAVGSSFIGRDGFLGVSFSRFNALYGIPGADALTEKPRIDMQQDKVQTRGEWRVGSLGIEAIRLWGGASSYAHNEIDFGSGSPQVGSRFTSRAQEGRVEVQHTPVTTPFGRLTGMVGTQFGHRELEGKSFEGDSLLDPARTSSIAGFWFEELQPTKRLRFQAALRIEQVNVSGTGLDLTNPATPALATGEKTFQPFSASAGALYELPFGVVARLTGQYVERAPDAAELFSKGAHDATGTFEIGNPFLTTEAARTAELGFKKDKGAFRFDASAYYTAFDGFIFKQLTGETCDVALASCSPAGGGGDLKQVLFSQRDAVFRGAELQAELDLGRIWHGTWGVDARYDFVRATFDDAASGNVPRIPPHRAGMGVYFRNEAWRARASVLHAFDQDKFGENGTPTKGYTLLGAELAYTFKLPQQAGLLPEMTIGLKAENLLDDDVRNAVSFKKDEVLEPGRSIRLYGIVKLN